MSPVEFIPLAEETGLIVELDRLALETALRDQRAFTESFATAFPHLPRPFMSVNVSGRQLSDLGEIAQLAKIISASGTRTRANQAVTKEGKDSVLYTKRSRVVCKKRSRETLFWTFGQRDLEG